MSADKQTETLLIIDVQQGLDDPAFGQRNNPQAEANMVRLLNCWRGRHWPVVHIQHASLNPLSPLRQSQPGFPLKTEVEPRAGEKLFVKNVNSAFIGTGLEEYLRANQVESLVMCGLTAEHCVSTSVRHAGNLGFNVTLVADATASFDCTDHSGNYFGAEQIHQVSLACLHGEFCTVQRTEDVVSRVT